MGKKVRIEKKKEKKESSSSSSSNNEEEEEEEKGEGSKEKWKELAEARYSKSAVAIAAGLTGQELMTADSDIPLFPMAEMAADDTLIHDLFKLWFVVGKTETGKSWLVRTLMFYLRDIVPYWFFMTHTKFNRFYLQHAPNAAIMPAIDPDFIEMILETNAARLNIRGINPYVALVLDDIASERNIHYIQPIIRVSMEGRHHGILTISSTQRLKRLPATIRDNARYIVLFTTTNSDIIDSLYAEFGRDFRSKQDFTAFLDLHTRDHAMIIINQDPQLRGRERYFKFKSLSPEEMGDFCVGNDDYWGGNRHELWRAQLKQFPLLPKYKRSYLKKLFNKTKITDEEVDGDQPEFKAMVEGVNPLHMTRMGRGQFGGGGSSAISDEAVRDMITSYFG
jgi:hypothetical protein